MCNKKLKSDIREYCKSFNMPYKKKENETKSVTVMNMLLKKKEKKILITTAEHHAILSKTPNIPTYWLSNK